MADTPCPACGKLNPVGLDECQFCHAELIINITSPPDAEEQEFPPGEDVPLENLSDPEPALPEEVEKERIETGSPGLEAGSETPEWLRRIRIRHASEQPAIPSPSSDFSGWIEPERQADDTVPSVPVTDPVHEPVERPGPLDGENGAISPEQFLRVQPPSSFSYNLRITGTQHAHADLLDSIVVGEGTAVPVARRKEASVSPFLRWGIATILFISILWPVITNRQQAPLPLFPEETGQVNNLIAQLPEEASILLVFDYDPGFSGELDAAAAAVVDHVISRGAYLTLVSTIPAGPVLAERFLSSTVRHNYVRNIHYVNLGFIPGGPTGLLSFAEDPQHTLPYTLDGEAAWSGDGGSVGTSVFPPLEGIEELSDFDLVLILADDSFTARSWIEQVQPRLVGESFQTPMAMVVSAQVEPLVRPYYDANPRQVQGFVTGLRGGTAYEQMTGRETVPGYFWDAFIFGMNAAGLLLLFGALVGIAYIIINQREQEHGGGGA